MNWYKTYNKSPYKRINDFITEGYRIHPKQGFIREQQYEKLVDYFGEENISERLVCDFISDHNRDFVLENLQSHSYKALERRLQNVFYGYDISIQSHPDEISDISYTRIRINDISAKEFNALIKTKEFNNILQFFNYSVSSVDWNESGTIYIEPIYSESGAEFINDYCFGVVYHITSARLAKTIERTGIRCRCGERLPNGEIMKYRNFPERVYVYAMIPDDFDMTTLKLAAKQLLPYTNDKDIAIFKCYVNGENFYRDTAMPYDSAYFTYTTIPPENIERIF